MNIRNFILLLLLSLLFISATTDNKPSLFIIGDSTVKNGSGKGDGGLWGWGDPIIQYFDTTKIHVENHARGGTSSRTYRSLGLWQPVLNKIKKGDYVLMQFGHNDGSPVNDTLRARGTIPGIGEDIQEIDNMLTGKHETVHTYGWYMTQFIKEVTAKGGIPVIISPIPRNKWENGKVPRNDQSYGLWSKQVAQKQGIGFIDLNDKLAVAMEKLGEENVTGSLFFKKDHTHTSAKGSILAASLVAEGLNELKKCNLKSYLLNDPVIIFPVKKNIFIIGDSTVANGDSLGLAVGWGKYLAEFMDTTRVNVINKARGGRSSRTYLYEGLWEEVRQLLKPGDFVLIQFGHNDGGYIDKPKFRGSIKGTGNESVNIIRPDSTEEKVYTYGWYIRKYVSDSKDKGAIPIVCSQVTRNKWHDGRVERVKYDYGLWAKQAAKESGAWFVDLNNIIADNFEAMGADSVKIYFPKDHTHTNDDGAKMNAAALAGAIKVYKGCPLRGYVSDIK